MDAFEILIDLPAWLLGQVLAIAITTAVTVSGPVAGLYAGAFIHRMVPLPIDRMVLAVIVGLWIAVIPFRAMTFAGVALLQYADSNDD